MLTNGRMVRRRWRMHIFVRFGFTADVDRNIVDCAQKQNDNAETYFRRQFEYK